MKFVLNISIIRTMNIGRGGIGHSLLILLVLQICNGLLLQGQVDTDNLSRDASYGATFEPVDPKEAIEMGHSQHASASYDDALELYYTALGIYEEDSDSLHIASTLTEIGKTYLRLSKNDEAETVFKRSLRISELLGDAAGIQISTADVAVIHQRRDEIDKAIPLYRKSLSMARNQGNLTEHAVILGNMGSTFRRGEQYDSSLYYLMMALPLKVEIGNGRSIAHTLNDIADTYFFSGDLAQSVKWGQMALDTGLFYEATNQEAYARFILSQAYEKLGDYNSAYLYLSTHKIVYDSITDVTKDKAISDLRIKYETSKKEQRITTLATQNKLYEARRKVMTFGFIIFLLIAGLVVFVLWTKRKTDKVLLQKSLELREARSKLFANISHEFRTPVSLMLGPLHRLRDEKDGVDTEAQLSIMEQNAHQLMRSVEQLSDLARATEHTLTLNISETDICEVIENIVGLFAEEADSKDIDLRFENSGQKEMLYVDWKRFESILINLVSNAMKFTGAGDEIVVTISNLTPGHISIVVADSGLGITAEDLPHIFDRYFHKDKKKQHYSSGVGLGLALTRNIAELHGGTIQVKSEPGKRTAFTLDFLKGKSHLESLEHVMLSEGEASVRDTSRSWIPETKVMYPSQSDTLSEKPKVLVVEDNPSMLNFIKDVLTADFDTTTASNGLEGLDQALEIIPDMVISDVMMPGMRGTELCATLKNDTRTSHIPIILLTAMSSDEDRIAGFETQADAYLTKPFIPKELILRISNLLEASSRIRAQFSGASFKYSDSVTVGSRDQEFLQKLHHGVEQNYTDSDFGVGELATLVLLSRSQLHRKLKFLTGVTPNSLLRTFRLTTAHRLIDSKTASISEIAHQVGFSSPSYFIKCFQEEFGKTPGKAMSGL